MRAPGRNGDEEDDAFVTGALRRRLPPTSPLPWHPLWHRELAAPVDESPARAAAVHADALARAATRAGDALALSFKLPFCAAHCLCCDRPIRAAQPPEVIDEYVSLLIDELRAVAAIVGSGRDVLQLHLGGGTVNELFESQLVRLVMAVQGPWRLPGDAETSVECDPRRASLGLLELLHGLGFDHLRFGVLDLDADVQRAIGRHQSPALIDDACDTARSAGFETIDLELIAGLPRQTPARWYATLERVVALAPERISLGRYRHRPWLAPSQLAIEPRDLPGAATVKALLHHASHVLRDAGYRWIGADKFVLESDLLSRAADDGRLRRSLISYTATPHAPVLGFGAGALSDIEGSLFWNEAELPDWRQAMKSGRLPVARARVAGFDDERRRRAAEHLLCTQELPRALVSGRLEDAWQRLAGHEASGLLAVHPDRIVLTDAGRHELLALCAEVASASGA